MQPRQVRDTLKKFVAKEQQAGRVPSLLPSQLRSDGNSRNLLNLVGMPILLLIVSPLLLLALPFFLIQLRRCELSDPEVAPLVIRPMRTCSLR